MWARDPDPELDRGHAVLEAHLRPHLVPGLGPRARTRGRVGARHGGHGRIVRGHGRSCQPKVRKVVQASASRSRSLTPARRRSCQARATTPFLGVGLVDGEQALDQVAGQLGVHRLHAVRHEQLGGPAQLAVVAQHEVLLEAVAVAGQARRRGVAPGERLDGRLGRGLARADGEVDALEPDAGGQAHRRGVAGHQHPVAHQLRHHRRSPASGMTCAEYSLSSPPSTSGGDHRVALEVGDELLGPHARRGQLGQLSTTPTATLSRLV